jgi:myo-inositol 2-dehydrogenase / D-chiro-inositol 1-dehydrogenase
MTVRVGIIGAGNIGPAHARTLARVVSGSTVGVAFDADAARATALAREVGARTVGSAIEVFEADDVDAVLIASPDGAGWCSWGSCAASTRATCSSRPGSRTTGSANR